MTEHAVSSSRFSRPGIISAPGEATASELRHRPPFLPDREHPTSHRAPDGLLLRPAGQPEPLPRWQIGVYWRADGHPLWREPRLLADPTKPGSADADDAERVARAIARLLMLPEDAVYPAYEDPVARLWGESRLPGEAPPPLDGPDPTDPRLAEPHARAQISAALDPETGEPQGWAMPLHRAAGDWAWSTGRWSLRRGHVFLIEGDSPIGLRLPLDSLTWTPPPAEPEQSLLRPVEALDGAPPGGSRPTFGRSSRTSRATAAGSSSPGSSRFSSSAFRCSEPSRSRTSCSRSAARSSPGTWWVKRSTATTSRYVDSSLERLQVRVDGLTEPRYVVTCNGRPVPVQPTDTPGTYVGGVRFRAWKPPSALHPTIGVHAPLTFDIVDRWNSSLGGCRYHVSHPGGRAYDRLPVNANEAQSRRASRFEQIGHSPGRIDLPDVRRDGEYPRTLDLRLPAMR